jgi:pimeloyl-ACP methyl ester carboxylesterase
MYQAIPGSALWIIPRGGHVPILGARGCEFQEIAIPFLRGERAPR